MYYHTNRFHTNLYVCQIIIIANPHIFKTMIEFNYFKYHGNQNSRFSDFETENNLLK